MMKKNSTNILLAGALILLLVVARIVNHELMIPNLASVAALGLFSGAVIKDLKVAFLLPLLAYFISDVYIEFFGHTSGFYGIEQFFTYGSMMLVTLLGSRMGKPKALKVFGYSIAGSLIFFLVSNFGVWVSIQFGTDLYGYGKGLDGLATTYLMALPFYDKMGTTIFLNTFLGGILFSGILFGAYQLLQLTLVKNIAKENA